jgi:hypothetical protein
MSKEALNSFAVENISIFVRFEVFTAVTMTNGVFWDVTLCGSCKNRRFGELSVSFIKLTRISELGTTLAVTSYRRTLRRNMTSALTRATRRNIPEDTILHFCISCSECSRSACSAEQVLSTGTSRVLSTLQVSLKLEQIGESIIVDWQVN